MRSRVDTADIVQEVAARTLARARSIEVRDELALMAYLREGAANLIRDEHRNLARHGTTIVLAESLLDRRPSPLQDVISSDLNAKYQRALGQLRSQDRELVIAHVESGFSHAQLGYLVGKEPNAARMALQRALQRLAEHMLKE